MSVMHEAIENGVGNGWIADDLMPMLDRKLACHHGRVGCPWRRLRILEPANGTLAGGLPGFVERPCVLDPVA